MSGPTDDDGQRTGGWRIVTQGSRIVYRNPWMDLREDAIERRGPDGAGQPGIYAVVVKPHAAVVVPWDGTHVHLVGQHRHPLGAWSWEFPQGAVHVAPPGGVATGESGGAPDNARRSTGPAGDDDHSAGPQPDEGPAGDEAESGVPPTDDPADVARAELLEETGFRAGRLVRLGAMAFAPGMADQRFTAFLATDLTPGPPQPEAAEEGLLVPRAVTPEALDAMIDAGDVVDAATVATWHLAVRRGLE